MDKFIPQCPKDKSRSVRWLRAIPTKGRVKTYRCNECKYVFAAEEPLPESEKKKGPMIEFSCLECSKVTQVTKREWESGDPRCGKCGSMNVMNT